MEGVSQYLTSKLNLKVNPSKSALAHPEARKFLSYQLYQPKEGQAAHCILRGSDYPSHNRTPKP